MHRILWAIARKSFSRGARLKTQMSKATLAVSCFFIAGFVFYLISLAFMYSDGMIPSQNSRAILLVNTPDSFNDFLTAEDEKGGVTLSSLFIRSDDSAYFDFMKYQDRLDSGRIGLAVIFPEDFDMQMTSLSAESRPQILTYYDPSDTNSKDIRSYMVQLLTKYGNALQTQNGRIVTSSDYFHIVPEELTASGTDEGNHGLKSISSQMIIPFLLFITIMYAAMESGVSSIAGEKERGTFAAILLTPVRRIEIVLGNALGILLYSMLPASFLICILVPAFGLFSISAALYLFVICISLSLLLTSLILILSILNRSILSAQSSFLPIFFLMLIVCITAMQQKDVPSTIYFLFPFYGHYYGITAALEGRYSLQLLLGLFAICSVFTVLLLYIAEKLLHIERFTTYIEAEDHEGRELRRNRNTAAMRAKLSASPQNIVYGYLPVKHPSALRLLSRQLALPTSLLAVFQPISLIAPLLLYLRTKEATVFLNGFANAASGMTLESTANTVLPLFGKLMQSKTFILSMSFSYVCIIAVYVLIVRVFEKNTLATAGLPLRGPHGGRRALYSYARGLMIGFCMMLGVYLLLLFTGQIRIQGFGLDSTGLPLFLIYILMWIPQGASEELMMRGYMMPRLSAKFGRTAAVGITSLVFSVLHIGNAGFSIVAFLNLLLISVFFALFALFTQEIWTVCAVHSIWNFAQGNLFGLQVSGTESVSRLVHTSYTGNSLSLLTGGDFGPEGGLIVTAVVTLSLLILLFTRHKLCKAETV